MRYIKTFFMIIAFTVLFSCSSFAASRCVINVDEKTKTYTYGYIDFYRNPGVRIKKIQMKIGKKYYKAKLEFDKKSENPYYQLCYYNFQYPTQKKGKKVAIIVTDTKGKKYTKRIVLKKPGGLTWSATELLESDTTIEIESNDFRKGDTVNVKIGRDIYTRTVEKDYYSKKKEFSIPVYNLRAGYQYTVYIKDKYNAIRGSLTSNIIYG